MLLNFWNREYICTPVYIKSLFFFFDLTNQKEVQVSQGGPVGESLPLSKNCILVSLPGDDCLELPCNNLVDKSDFISDSGFRDTGDVYLFSIAIRQMCKHLYFVFNIKLTILPFSHSLFPHLSFFPSFFLSFSSSYIHFTA